MEGIKEISFLKGKLSKLLKKVFQSYYNYFIRERDIERAQDIATAINNFLNSYEFQDFFPEYELSDLANWLDELFSNIPKIIEKGIKNSKLPTNPEERLMRIHEIIESVNKNLMEIFCKKKIVYILTLMFLRKTEVLGINLIPYQLILEIKDIYEEFFKQTIKTTLSNLENKQNIIIENKDQLIENYVITHPAYHYELEEYYKKIYSEFDLNNAQKFVGEQLSEKISQYFKLEDFIKEQRELTFYTTLSENYINDLREEFIRFGNYEQYKEYIEYILEKLKIIINRIKIIPKNLYQLKGIVRYLSDELYYLFIDQKVVELIMKIKEEDIRKMRDPTKSASSIEEEFNLYLSEITGIPFYESILREIVLRIYTKAKSEGQILLELDIDSLIADYTEKNIGIRLFSNKHNLFHHYFISSANYFIESENQD